MKSTYTSKIPDLKYCRREGNLYIVKFSLFAALTFAVISLALTVVVTMLRSLPAIAAFLMSAGIGCIIFAAAAVYLLLLKHCEYKNMEYLADSIDQPIEFRCPISFRGGKRRIPGYLFLTYDECHLIATERSGVTFDVRDSKLDHIVLKKSELYAAQVINERRIDLLVGEGTGYQLSVFSLKGLVYLMDRDMWTLRCMSIASYT